MNIHGYSCLFYSRIFMVQFYIHEYSTYKTGIIHEYSRIYTMNILELFLNIHELFMLMKAGQVTQWTSLCVFEIFRYKLKSTGKRVRFFGFT